MMIHVEHASVASRAVMTSFRFKDMANQTISSPFMVWVIQEKAPEERNLTRIADDSLEE